MGWQEHLFLIIFINDMNNKLNNIFKKSSTGKKKTSWILIALILVKPPELLNF